jgi:hypothetical protein
MHQGQMRHAMGTGLVFVYSGPIFWTRIRGRARHASRIPYLRGWKRMIASPARVVRGAGRKAWP